MHPGSLSTLFRMPINTLGSSGGQFALLGGALGELSATLVVTLLGAL